MAAFVAKRQGSNKLLKYFRALLFEKFRPHKTAYKPQSSGGQGAGMLCDVNLFNVL